MKIAYAETFIIVKGVPNPTRGDIVARDKPISAKVSSNAFVTQISKMTENVLHGKAQSVLNTNHILLTSKRQLHMSAGLDRAQTNTSSMHGILKNDSSSGVTGLRGPRKANASIMAVISVVLLE